VFNAGRIVQVGAPAEVYERPATAFVAGFVGTSNLLSGPSAVAILGHEGTFTVRPEKIQIEDAETIPADAAAPDDSYAAAGRIRSVVYLGPDTRFHVTLDAGGELVVTQQNLATTSTEVLAQQGRAVRLVWKRQHTREIAEA
jgi:putative spermidine/putrescine transport system ATP-binding protein